MINVSLVDADIYQVIVEREQETTHVVHMSQEYYRQLCGATVTHEWLLVQAFNFLLERESNTEILSEFDLHDINRYFPEFEDEMTSRLGG